MKSKKSKSYQRFLKDYQTKNIVPARKSAIFLLLFYLFFSVLDAFLTDSMNIVTLRIIFSVVMGILLCITYIPKYILHWQKIYSLFIIIAGLGVITISTYIDCPMKTLYSQGLLLVIFYGYTMNKLLLIPSTIAGLTITLVYAIVTFNVNEVAMPTILTSLFFQLTANIIGIFNISYRQRVSFKKYSLRIKDKNKSKKLLKLNQILKNLATTDGLTGIANRRYFDKILDQAILKSKKNKKPLSLIMLDIDYFKYYNDYYGHVQGDICLKKIASLLENATIQSSAKAARFGGEEFMILMPNTSASDCQLFVKKIMADLNGLKIENHDSPTSQYITASYGIVSVCKNYSKLSAKFIVNSVDACLYKAKNQGKNRFVQIKI
jgi:diguanylate cyclase (GGDEF)-like protein